MTARDLIERWSTRRHELARLKATVDGVLICDEVLADLEQLGADNANEPLSLTEAARESGYSAGHLGREIKAGRIPNAGRENAPKILRRDLPRKVGFLPESELAYTVSRKRIAHAVAHPSNTEASDG
jgi:hypothetical protein